MNQQPTAIILGARFPALGVLSSLAPRGVPCIVCETRRLPAAWSRRARYVPIPDPRTDPENAAIRIAQVAKGAGAFGQRPVLIPTDDHFAQILATHADLFAPLAEVCAGPAQAVSLMTDQLRFSDWALARGLPVPQSVRADAFTGQIPFPVIVKPLNFSGFLGMKVALPDGVRASDLRFRRIADDAEWRAFADRFGAILPHFVVQEFVPGHSDTMYSLGLYADRSSRVRGLFVGRKLRGFPAAYGNTILGQNDAVPKALIAEVRETIKALGYTGIAEVEYRKDPETGKYWLIEINPRAWSWIAATRVSRADIPWMAFSDLTGQPIMDAIENGRPGRIKAVRAIPDLINVFWRYRDDAPGWVLSPRQWFRSLRAKRLVVIDFNGFDPMVSAYCFALALRDAIRNER